MHVEFGVLGPVAAWDETAEPLALKGPRHRAVLARLLIARRRVVPVARLVEDLWGARPPADAVGTVRTFVAGLRRALEPARAPRTPSRLLVTEGPGYALRAAPDRVDAWCFERAAASSADEPPAQAVATLTGALELWRGPAYADFAEEPWARAERSRLTELRLSTVERRAEAQLALGAAAEAVPDLDAHVAEHPWREDAWQLLALALYRSGRQADALSVLRRARRTLREQLGVEPGPRLRRTEEDILRHADHLDPGPADTAAQVWAQATAAYDSTVPSRARTRLESTAGLMRDLAVTGGGGLEAARRHRAAAVAAAEQLGDPELTARVIGAYDVPAIWTRSDDLAQADLLVGAAERTLRLLPPTAHDASRARLLATIAVESRGTPPADGGSARAHQAAHQAEQIARRVNDATLLLFALNGVFMQTFERAGLADRRDTIGAEIMTVAAHHGLFTYEVLGCLIRLQSHGAKGDFTGADRYAAAADALSERHELPLVPVFTTWYRALRTAATEPLPRAESAYREAAKTLDGSGMPGLENGLLPLALLSLQVSHGAPVVFDAHADWGPYEPWVRPLLLLSEGCDQDAVRLLRSVPSPPRDLLYEALWCLLARAAVAVGDRALMRRAHTALEPARDELAGAGSGLLTVGPVAVHLDALADALSRP
ncbi:AfsR/SARP family transcriptional regulator [Streptomyces fulvoviolaceus]|uniref:AfsR/SARP family transcriptional regulator n=1 Tax=Streptomyces fulvoviolaceus TaxID=285535 RepID=UPI0021C079EC|nr:BTAD domain-containing putative transcriptional regulator [Streptomyces fulvoviolaceus]MCT9075685.1 winged helix-turn-helix domain-containing protein [Streptomyces fulvoviolaceus]